MIPLLLGMSVGCAKAATSPAAVAQDSLNSSQVHFRNENSSISIINSPNLRNNLSSRLNHQSTVEDLALAPSRQVGTDTVTSFTLQEVQQQHSIAVPLPGRRRLLSACPTISSTEGSVSSTDGWNVWSASCAMDITYDLSSGNTVMIKKDSSMSGELVIEATSGSDNRHFYVNGGALEMKDVTLAGGYAAVSSFVLCIVMNVYF